MLRGCRVVRGPDWASRDKDGGEGGLGTVVEVNAKSGKVKVIWDMGHEGQVKAGHDAKFELRLYDNAPAGVVHEYVRCDACDMDPIVGLRWKCGECEDYDLCSPCYMANRHQPAHPFFRFDTPNTPIVTVPPRTRTPLGHLHGILEGAAVQRGLHWKWGNQDGGRGQVGEVEKLAEWGQNSYRGAVRVKWPNGNMGKYRVGGEGCVDLLCIGETKVHPYYPSHLPPLNAKGDTEYVLEKGNKVRMEVQPHVAQKMLTEHKAWKPEYKDYVDQVGTVIEFSNKGRVAWLAFDDAQLMPALTPLLSKVHVFSPGDAVRITNNYNAFQELQRGHGGYNDRMDDAMGQVGRVEAVDEDGDLEVSVGGHTWILAPATCTLVSEGYHPPLPPKPSLPHLPSRSLSSSGASTSSLSSVESSQEDDGIARGVERLLREFMPEETGGTGSSRGSGVEDLLEAAAQNDLSTVKSITSSSPGLVDKKMQGKTALHMASYGGHLDMVRHLLKVKADPNVTDDEGDTALHHAVAGECKDVVQVLVDHSGIKLNAVNHKKRTALHMAVTMKQPDIIHILLNRNANPNTQDEDGDSPLHDAVNQEDEEIWKLLLRTRGLSLDVFNKDGHNPLHEAVIAKNEDAVEAILEKQPQLSASNTRVELCSPLHIAAINGYTAIAGILIAKGKRMPNQKDGVGRTALHLAVVRRSLQMVELLLHSGFDVNVQDEEGNTASHLAWKRAYAPTASLLSKRDSRGDQQQEPDIGDDHEIPYLLASRGANLELRNKEGKTPLDFAPKAVAALLKKVALKTSRRSESELSPPPKWAPMGEKKVRRLELSSQDPLTREEFQMVCDAFKKSLRFRSVHEIFRIQNLDVWERYATHKRRLERQYGVGQSGERYLFHGTKPATVDRIVNQGVDFRVVERAAYGDGAYFASDAKMSDFYTEPNSLQRRFMFMVKVLAGEYTVGTRGIKKPPLKTGSQDEHFDCCVDNVNNPRIYVVFDNSQCYPEYLIVYE